MALGVGASGMCLGGAGTVQDGVVWRGPGGVASGPLPRAGARVEPGRLGLLEALTLRRAGSVSAPALMGITFEQYCQALGNPDFMTAEELAGIIHYCYQLPGHLCVRELVVAPT